MMRSVQRAKTFVALANEIRGLPGVQATNLWMRVPGKERIYIDLTSRNGGRNWNEGIGHRLIVELSTGEIDYDRRSKWAGAATRNHHEEIGSLEAIEAAVKRFIEEHGVF
jgi:hypothetical protein